MSFILGALSASICIVVIAFIKSMARLEEGHAAVLTSFGRIMRESNGEPQLLGSGFHWKAPWEVAHEFSVMERVLPIREDEREVEILARDGTLVRLDPQVRFNFDPRRMENFVFGMRRPLSHLRELFRGLLSVEIGKFGGESPEEGSFAEIRRQRHVLNSNIQRSFQTDVGLKYGIQFRAVEIAEILPPAELAQALNSVQRVEAENNTLLNRVRAECEQQIAAAEHSVYIEKMRSDAAATDINIASDAIAQLHETGVLGAYLKRRRDEATSLSKTLYLNII